ncbi:MAG: helix-turn-helix domain-containing protein [Nitrososphaera sp.]|nr:helix-turn-helix domain-containing protein [Nitrososphaera sp.]
MGTRLVVENLAALVKAKRGERGLRETAEEIGEISASTLSRIEQGKIPDLDTFMRLCDWLQVAPDQFFQGAPGEKSFSEASNIPVLSPSMSTPELIEVHLRADKELDPETAEALANMVKAAYNAIRAGKLGRKH